MPLYDAHSDSWSRSVVQSLSTQNKVSAGMLDAATELIFKVDALRKVKPSVFVNSSDQVVCSWVTQDEHIQVHLDLDEGHHVLILEAGHPTQTHTVVHLHELVHLLAVCLPER